MKQDDIVYLFYWCEPALRYYDEFYGFDYDRFKIISSKRPATFDRELDHFRNSRACTLVHPEDRNCIPQYILGISDDLTACKEDFKKLAGQKRVWFIFSHYQKDAFLDYLDNLGVRLDSHFEYEASSLLYDFSNKGQMRDVLKICN